MADPGFPVGGDVHPLGGGVDLRHGHFSVKMYAKTKESANAYTPHFSKASCALTCGQLWLSCVLLANYASKWKMSSGPYKPIF